jgi:dolichyl-phosphate-mannose--protein O-mannosyl transferase
VRGVILLGNPVIMWGGLLALLGCAWGWVVERRRDAFLILAMYIAFYASWILIPRKVAFFYYYYPAGMILSLALAFVFNRWRTSKDWLAWAFACLCWAFFIYFFPILAALKIPAADFRKWMWLGSWI